MDVVWLKRDVRLLDHGPFAAVAKESDRKICILYLYEPDQLSQPTVHGSQLHFINEGLYSLDCKLSGRSKVDKDLLYKDELKCITVCYGECVDIFQKLHSIHPIKNIYAHMETGHMASYQRDIRWRRWCRKNNILFFEFNQTGVTRLLKHRNDFSKKLQQFLSQPMYHHLRSEEDLVHSMRNKIIQPKDIISTTFLSTTATMIQDESTKNTFSMLIPPEQIVEIPKEHQSDREGREQFGGEHIALKVLHSFFSERGYRYSQHISSPNTSWNSCSRLSPYITWGNISLRYVIQTLQQRKSQISSMNSSESTVWKRSLVAFSSRIHWRTHFIQKLECQPNIETLDLCQAYQALRRQPGDFNEHYFNAWCTGNTGFPFVDACMRCLLKHGWLNFRMRAMLVSFACWNLWLDWKTIGKHLARCFLDYEPGIHYPQLQMQAGTTGINAMRVYNVTKQGYDHDPKGIFIKKYIPELESVPLKYIHEPQKMPVHLQQQLNVYIVDYTNENTADFVTNGNNKLGKDNNDLTATSAYYSRPIVDEKTSAKLAKDKFAAIRNLSSTKQLAKEVYIKHGSRNNNQQRQKRNHQDAKVVESLFVEKSSGSSSGSEISPKKNKKAKLIPNQATLIDLFSKDTTSNEKKISKSSSSQKICQMRHADELQLNNDIDHGNPSHNKSQTIVNFLENSPSRKTVKQTNMIATTKNDLTSKSASSSGRAFFTTNPYKTESTKLPVSKPKMTKDDSFWTCKFCTFQNEKLLAPICEMCSLQR